MEAGRVRQRRDPVEAVARRAAAAEEARRHLIGDGGEVGDEGGARRRQVVGEAAEEGPESRHKRQLERSDERRRHDRRVQRAAIGRGAGGCGAADEQRDDARYLLSHRLQVWQHIERTTTLGVVSHQQVDARRVAEGVRPRAQQRAARIADV